MAPNDNGHLTKIFGDDESSILINACNNNNKSAQNSVQQTQQLPLTPQLSRARNFISDMVNFSPMNGIMSQDNASGELKFKSSTNQKNILVVFDETLLHISFYHILSIRYTYYLPFIIIHKFG